jgi:putative nucleotidyltransferase with HDIG domain
MAPLLTRSEALGLMKNQVLKKSIVYHVLAVEAIMRELARYLGEDEEQWGLTGLLHDIDYERTEATPELHSLLAEDMLKGSVDGDVITAIKAHNFEHTGVKPQTKLQKALVAADAVSGLLIACALVMPSKKLADVRVESVGKKFKDKDFAKGAHRERILFCEQIGIPREKFFDIALRALRESASQIGL